MSPVVSDVVDVPVNAGPWSIVYAQDGEVFFGGPFATESEAMQWARENDYSNFEDDEDGDSVGAFDVFEQNVYLLDPTHRLTDLSADDLGVGIDPGMEVS